MGFTSSEKEGPAGFKSGGLIEEKVIAGAAVSSVTFNTNVNLDSDKEYVLTYSLVNPTATDTNLLMPFNGDAGTESTYKSKNIQFHNGSVAGARANGSYAGIIYGNSRTWGTIRIWRGGSGYPVAQVFAGTDGGAAGAGDDLLNNIVLQTDGNVTRIDLKVQGGDACIGIGSVFRLRKV